MPSRISPAAYAWYNAIRDEKRTAGAIALCISLTACGSTDDAMGDDWRASRDVAASGTITHDGESDVLVSFIHENGDETELIWDPLHTIVPCVPERREVDFAKQKTEGVSLL